MHLRELFIDVLGHDLRNPLGAIGTEVLLLYRLPKGEKAKKVRDMKVRSVTGMTGLIDDVLDFARGRLAGGHSLKLEFDAGLEDFLRQVVSALELGFPARVVKPVLKIDRSFECDSARMAQMVSNLLGYANTHGIPVQPVQLRAIKADETHERSVENFGPIIPAQIAKHLFVPFFQGTAKTGQQGLAARWCVRKSSDDLAR